ncbi:hypothetical protein PPL_04238 [Heterostelium album PN500]|uniref:Uncharacterized protein n=1 Tax=Heterostelium pallidum (strain ATCC 26659 / Pp 5 / PN500) TaxID=670386 RepID=D3B707_HETP5|nr:hypothetical protein PPL_04238 [Heterostelium album PN500]EFA82550.1 hypothetical protein PPL_04238 [Heterostelium album PN500]|eukprot:XP_020434667.1 hypothetical protein PPL_04238 [Heterostelium album PN500]
MIKLSILVLLLSLISLTLSIRIVDFIDKGVKATSSQPTIYVIGDFYSMGLTVSIYDQFTGEITVIVNNDPAFTELSIVDTLLLTPSEVVFMTDISAVNQSQFFAVSYANDGTSKFEAFNLADGSPTGFSVSLPQINFPAVSYTYTQIKIDPINQLAYVMVGGPGQYIVEDNDLEDIRIDYGETTLACGFWSGCAYLFTIDLTSQSVVKTLDITKFPSGIGYTISTTILLPNGTLIGPGEPTVMQAYFKGAIITLDVLTGAYSFKVLADYQVDFISGGVYNNTVYMLVKKEVNSLPSNASRLIGYDIIEEKIVLDIPNTNITDRHELIFI